MTSGVNAQRILQFARYADAIDNGGNGNGYVDTTTEKDLFYQKCRTAGFDDMDKIMDDYNSNRLNNELKYESDKTTSDSSLQTAVISALSDNTALRSNDANQKTASTIKAGSQNADNNTNLARGTTGAAAVGAIIGSCFGFPLGTIIGGAIGGFIGYLAESANTNGDFRLTDPDTWGNNERQILEMTDLINKDNVMDVVSDGATMQKYENADKNVRAEISDRIITSLVQLAREKQVDISSVIANVNGQYVVGRGVSGVEFGQPISEHLSQVVNTIKSKINASTDAMHGRGSDQHYMLTQIAKRIDATMGNGNGYIDRGSAEEEELKRFATDHGIDIDDIQSKIQDRTDNGLEVTDSMQKTVYNIFDPEQKEAARQLIENERANIAAAMSAGIGKGDDEDYNAIGQFFGGIRNSVVGFFEGNEIKYEDGNKALLDATISNVNGRNVVQILDSDPQLVDKIMNKYSHCWAKNQTMTDDKYQRYTNQILGALMQAARMNGINIDDIVIENNGKLYAGSASNVRAGSSAIDEFNVAQVIKTLHARVKSEML